jgi:hypothetical protein
MIYSDCIRKTNEISDLQAGPVVVVEQLRATYSSILGLPSSKCTGVLGLHNSCTARPSLCTCLLIPYHDHCRLVSLPHRVLGDRS